ncbi:MAG: type II secretion system F family protein [Euryarchaeota archaeon]|nr:type II secretion system F family protein [Euryarchaeota archaeon]MBT5255494.1 type II secretion system F family protein [Euryarchaeota archaeon]MDG1547057.1 type II secretion system F family protein [Candidatus Poseidoniaceae archaeon]
MRILDEKREGLYVIRTLDVLMSSGVGLEAALHTIGQGGYGIISEDFSKIMKKLSSGNSRGIEYEIKSMMNTAESDGYRRLLNTLYNNVTQNTDIVETLRKQGSRLEEERAEEVKKYIEELGGVPETLLSIGMIGPIILSIAGLIPQLLTGDIAAFMSIPDPDLIKSVVNGGLVITLVGMFFIGLKAHTKDPGL